MPPRKTCGKRGGKRIKRGGNELTSLRLDPYYLKRLRGKGVKEWLEERVSTTNNVSAIDQEILHDLQYGIGTSKQTSKPSSEPTVPTRKDLVVMV